MRPPSGATSAPVRQGPDWWFPWVVGTFAAVSIVVWAGGALAIATTGGGPMPRLVDAGGALVRLPGSASQPAMAWPEPLRDRLPGAPVYWACQLSVIAVVVATGLLSVTAWKRIDDPPGPLGNRPDAGFAARRHLKRLNVRRPVPGRVTVGRSNGRLVACERQASLAVFGPSGCGKTAGFAIPALLEWEGPIIATSVKSDLLAATINHRRSKGRVWVYDPERMSGDGTCSPWSPLPSCEDWGNAMRLAASMVEVVQPSRDNVEDSNYWYSQAAKGLAPYLHAAAIDGRGLTDVVRWVDTQNVAEPERILKRDIGPKTRKAWTAIQADPEFMLRWDDIHAEIVRVFRRMVAEAPDDRADLATLPYDEWPIDLVEDIASTADVEWQAELANAAGDPGAPLASARALWGKEAKLRGSVYATIEIVLRTWSEPGVGALARADRHAIDLDAWLGGNNTIFVVSSAHEQKRLRPVFTVLMQQAIRRAYDVASGAGGSLPVPCLVLLDEAANIAPLPDLPAYVSTARSHGITLVTVWQDNAQITATYGDRARTVLNNHRAKLYGTGLGDETSLDYVSRLVGEQLLTQRNVSTDLHGGRRSISEHHTYRRAAPADAIRRIDPNEAVLIYGSELPARVRLRPWFADRGLRAIANRPDLIARHKGV
jgi:type IV secretion system protein VirD4